MEHSERRRLEAVRRNLKRDLAAVEELLRTAKPARRLTRKQIQSRARNVCRTVKAKGATIDEEALRTIVAKHGMPFASVGALFQAGYLRRSRKGISLGKRGLAAVK